MPGVIPFLRHGPASYQMLNSSVTLSGGMLVVPDPINLGGILPAQSGSAEVLGVAGLDANFRTNQDMQNPANLAQQSPWIPVYYGCDIPVTYAGACDFGRLLVAGPNGTVSPYTPGDVIGDTVATPSVPASGTAITNPANNAVQVVITGGTMTAVFVNGIQVGVGAGTYQVPSTGSIQLTYTAAPTWAWTLVGSSSTAPAVPATNVVLTNTSGANQSVVISGGTMTAVVVSGVTVGAGAGTYVLPNGATITLTYSVAPTWTWTALVTTFDQIVGRCSEPLGVASATTVARARIGQLL